MAGYIGSKAVLLSTTAAVVTGDADIGGGLTVDTNTLFVDAANNRVGVGTSSPASALDVVGTVTADGLTVGGDILVSDGTPSITLSDADGTNQTFTLTHNSATSTFDVRNNTSHGNMLFRSYDGTSYQNKLRLDNSGDISFYEDTGTTPKFFWDASAERLGIGTSSPRSTLDVSGVATIGSGSPPELNLYRNVLLAVSSAAGWVNFGGRFDGSNYATGASVRGLTAGQWSSTSYATDLQFLTTAVGSTSLTERMRIDASGNLLLAKNSFTNAGAGHILSTETVDGAVHRFTRANNTGTQSHVRFITNAGSTIGSITTTTTATAYNTSSDYRLKENVVPLAGAADRLAQIPVHRFNFIADPDTTVDGFLAHEVQAFVPEAVTGEKDAVETVDVTDEEGNVIGAEERPVHQGIDQSKLVPLLTAALQEALTKIDALEARIVTLEGGAA